jgi:hypothetical protein
LNTSTVLLVSRWRRRAGVLRLTVLAVSALVSTAVYRRKQLT